MKLKPEFTRLDPASRLYGQKATIIGLTGGIATGKSTVARLLRQKGLVVVDADQLVKVIYQQQETLDFIRSRFPQVVEADQIQFPKLRELVFGNPETQRTVENFIYQRLPKAFQAAVESLNNPELIIYDVPLLFEKGLQSRLDYSVVVYAPREIQIERLMRRDSIGRELAEKILAQQWDIERKKSEADFVIANDNSETDLQHEVDLFLQKICLN